MLASFFMKWILPTIAWLRGDSKVCSVDEGVRRIHELTTSEQLADVTGAFYHHGVRAESKGCTLDVEKQAELWRFSCSLFGLDPATAAVTSAT